MLAHKTSICGGLGGKELRSAYEGERNFLSKNSQKVNDSACLLCPFRPHQNEQEKNRYFSPVF
ncbi:TPA: hypothetical protein DDZ06_03530 [Candidatus Uhrbacteria bacterium]|nr:hypothetical protein [Candidatus Uhrbacteria bacterium]